MIGLHRHSHFSKRDAIAKIPDIVKRTAELGQSAWALTDHGTTSGLVDAYLETMNFNRVHGTNIKFIFGVEAYWIPDFNIKDRKLSRHIILLAKNQVGYHNLLKLVTIGYGDKGAAPDNYYYTMRLTTDIIAQYHEGLIVTSACRGGILKDRDRAVERISRFKDIFADDFFLEIQSVTDDEQREYNQFVLNLAELTGVNIIVTEDSHYVYKDDAATHRKWIEADRRGGYYDTDDYFLHSDQDIRRALEYIPYIGDIISNTEALADKCEQVHIDFGKKHYPVTIPDNQKRYHEILRRIQLHSKIKAPSPEYLARIDYELNVLNQCDYLDYFLINEDFIRWCRQHDIHVGRGRGSVCGSLVAYLLDITRVDPLKFGLFFERFVNPERVSPPDIDTDVPNSKREQVIQYLKDTYKEVWHVRTFGTTAVKTAILRAGKSLGLSIGKIKSISEDVDSVDEISDPDVKLLATNFLGLIQSFGKHASAVIIFPSDTCLFCAIERQGGEYVCSYEFSILENMGLLKLDILGMKTLDTIDEAVRLIHEHHHIDIDLDNLPVDDQKTFDMLDNSDSLGCFQIESYGMRKLLDALKPKNLFEIVPLIALYRPSTIQSGVVDTFITNHKSNTFDCIHRALSDTLNNTCGILLYQEQTMQIVRIVAGYPLAKADLFRRAIGHKDNAKMDELIKTFVVDGINNGFDEHTMITLADWLKNCAGYQFNKSHSAAYALLSYQTAYLKAHFPVEFITAFLNSHSDEKQEDLIPYVSYAKNIGIKILPPDIHAHTIRWFVKNNSIVTAISFIKGIGDLQLPIDEDALSRLPKNKILCLIRAGALDRIASRKVLIRRFIRDDFVHQYKSSHQKLQKLRRELDNLQQSLIPNAEGEYTLKNKIQTCIDELKDIEAQYRAIEDEPEEVGESAVLGFSFSDRFKHFDISLFDEPDLKSKDIKCVLCFVSRFKICGSRQFPSALLTIETPSGNSFDLKMPSKHYDPVEENSFCILRIVQDKVRLVVDKHVRPT